MPTASATAIGSDEAWLKIIVACILNHLSFIDAVKTLESILAPFRDSQGALGPTQLRIWSAREWRTIRIKSFGMSIALAAAHLASRRAEPYLLLWGFIVAPAAKFVATGLRPRVPRGNWQLFSTRTANVLSEFSPLQNLPSPYRAPVALSLLLWAFYFGLEQVWLFFVVGKDHSRHLFVN
jgi:hypothetical protein